MDRFLEKGPCACFFFFFQDIKVYNYVTGCKQQAVLEVHVTDLCPRPFVAYIMCILEVRNLRVGLSVMEL